MECMPLSALRASGGHLHNNEADVERSVEVWG
jgi:hypothetical protein